MHVPRPGQALPTVLALWSSIIPWLGLPPLCYLPHFTPASQHLYPQHKFPHLQYHYWCLYHWMVAGINWESLYDPVWLCLKQPESALQSILTSTAVSTPCRDRTCKFVSSPCLLCWCVNTDSISHTADILISKHIIVLFLWCLQFLNLLPSQLSSIDQFLVYSPL